MRSHSGGENNNSSMSPALVKCSVRSETAPSMSNHIPGHFIIGGLVAFRGLLISGNLAVVAEKEARSTACADSSFFSSSAGKAHQQPFPA